eukprot:4604900-Prymnesium_polylepis.1
MSVRAHRRPHRRACACDARWTVARVVSVWVVCAVLKKAVRAGGAHSERRAVASGHLATQR